MDSDSDEDWYNSREYNRNRNRWNQDEDGQTFLEKHKNWFLEGLEISGWEYYRTERKVLTNVFQYRDIFKTFDENKYKQEPNVYRKCKLSIISSEEAICNPIDEEGMQIHIVGRANCGQAFSDDIVYVKILDDCNPAPDGRYYGEVMSFVDRGRLKNIFHPVFVCQIDKRQYHLMIPLCKTVPKLNILRGRLENTYPGLVRSRVEIHKHESTTFELKFDHYHKLNEGDKEKWLFVVVLLKWKDTNIHPLGAVIGVIPSSHCVDEGMSIIRMQNQSPSGMRCVKSDTAFKLQRKGLLLAEYLRKYPLIFQGFVDVKSSSAEEFVISVPVFHETNKTKFLLKINILDVCNAPNISTECSEENEERKRIKLRWKKRLYDYNETIYDRPIQNGIEVRDGGFIQLNPYQSIEVNHQHSIRFLQSIHTDDTRGQLVTSPETTRNDTRHDLEANLGQNIELDNHVSDVNSEVNEHLIIEHSIPFQMSFQHEQIIQIQFSSQEIAGLVCTVPQIFILTESIKFCLTHMEYPIKTLVRYATKKSLSKYRNVEEYKNTWIPIVEMESACSAVHGEESALINDVPVRFKGNQGIFDLDKSFCEQRDLDFGYIPNHDTPSQTKVYHKVPSGNFLCIMVMQKHKGETNKTFPLSVPKQEFLECTC